MEQNFNSKQHPLIRPLLPAYFNCRKEDLKSLKEALNLLNYESISEIDFGGERTIMENKYKLVVEGKTPNELGFELYDIEKDPGEKINLADEHPDIVNKMNSQLHEWQQSVLTSLTGADYK